MWKEIRRGEQSEPHEAHLLEADHWEDRLAAVAQLVEQLDARGRDGLHRAEQRRLLVEGLAIKGDEDRWYVQHVVAHEHGRRRVERSVATVCATSVAWVSSRVGAWRAKRAAHSASVTGERSVSSRAWQCGGCVTRRASHAASLGREASVERAPGRMRGAQPAVEVRGAVRLALEQRAAVEDPPGPSGTVW
jgi:hypothetical protein